MKKSTLGLILALFLLPAVAYGQLATTSLSIYSLGIKIVNAIWIVFTIIAVIAFIVAGVLLLTAFGEAEKIRKGRSAALWGVAGIVVAILAYSATTILETLIGA